MKSLFGNLPRLLNVSSSIRKSVYFFNIQQIATTARQRFRIKIVDFTEHKSYLLFSIFWIDPRNLQVFSFQLFFFYSKLRTTNDSPILINMFLFSGLSRTERVVIDTSTDNKRLIVVLCTYLIKVFFPTKCLWSSIVSQVSRTRYFWAAESCIKASLSLDLRNEEPQPMLGNTNEVWAANGLRHVHV